MKRKPPQKRRAPTARTAAAKRSSSTSGPVLWDQAARWYDALVGMQGSDYQQSLVLPGALSLLELRKGDRVLDLGCGQGVLCRYLSQRGFNVLGLDMAGELLRMARRRSAPEVRYVAADAADPKALPGKVFDGIACLLAVQNMEHLRPVFQNVRRWLKPGGRFVMVMTHPCFRIPRQTHWGFDEAKKIQYRRVDGYASARSIPMLTPPLQGSRGYTMTYHRPLADYARELVQAGMAIDRLEEWCSAKASQPGKRAKAENRARREFPLFLALRATPLP